MFNRWSNKLHIKTKQSKNLFFRILGFLKIFLGIFVFIITFWGIGSLIFEKTLASPSLNDGENNEYFSGIFFEVGAGLSKRPEKKIIFHIVENEIYQYNYNLVYEWGDILKYTYSPVYVIFLFPVSWFFTKISILFGYDIEGSVSSKEILIIIGAIFIITFFLRFFNVFGSWKSAVSQRKMNKIKSKIDEIKKKYSKDSGLASKQMQQKEISALYRQHNINPMSSALSSMMFMPFLSVIFIVVRTTYIIKITKLIDKDGTILFSFTSQIWESLKSSQFSNWRYILMVFVYFFILGLKFGIPWFLNKKKQKKIIENIVEETSGFNKGKIMKVLFWILPIYMFFVLPLGVSVYNIVSSLFEILRKLIFRFLLKKRKIVEILRKKGIETSIWKQLFSTTKTK